MKRQIIALGIAAVLAVFGVLALVSYANRADDRALKDAELVNVLRATAEAPAKTPVTELGSTVEVVRIPKVALVPGALRSPDDLTELEGLVTKSVLVPGDQLTAAKFADPEDVQGDAVLPKGMQELTIPVGRAQLVGGAVKAGDRVGVFSSYDGRGVTSNPINTLLVLRVDSGIAGAEGEVTTSLVTVAVRTLDAERLVHTLEFGKIWLSKQNDDTDVRGGKTITSEDVAP